MKHQAFSYAPRPAYAPARDLSYRTELAEVRRVARGIGICLMPWQSEVVEIATEYRCNAFGVRLYHYHDVVVSVPRQSGKTTMILPLLLHRIITRRGAETFFTAQTGLDARFRIKQFANLVTNPSLSLFAPFLKKNLEAGAEGFVNLDNDSFLQRFSPTPTGLHGKTPMLVVVDEFWAFTALQGEDLTGAISPGQITIRSESQTWWISTMGTEESAFMNGMVEAGRKGLDPTTCYFEWSLPEGADSEDPRVWWEFHPALGNTITERDLKAEFVKLKNADKLGEWLRAYCNRKTGTANPLISEVEWSILQDDDMEVPDEFAIAYEVAPGNSFATVTASWRNAEGEPFTRIIRQAKGTYWLPDYIAACEEHLKPAVVAADDGGPTRRLTEALSKRFPELEVKTLTMPEFGSACMGWLEAARDARNLHHDGSEALTTAVMNGALRMTNGVERFSRDESAKPIAALIGSAVALWAWDNRDAEKGILLAT